MPNPFTLISTKKIYENPWISVREDSVLKPNREKGVFWIIKIGYGAHTVILDEENNIYLNHEYAYGLWDYEYKIPGGGIDLWETPLEWAKREVLEEAWITATDWVALWSFRPMTVVLDTVEYIFLARNISHLKHNHEDSEVIVSHKIPFQKALDMVLNGEIVHSASVIAILKTARILWL